MFRCPGVGLGKPDAAELWFAEQDVGDDPTGGRGAHAAEQVRAQDAEVVEGRRGQEHSAGG